MARAILPSVEQIKAMLAYDPDSGIFRWLCRPECPPAWNGKHAGKIAGSVINIHEKGWRSIHICINRKYFYAHRLAWKIMTGAEPPFEIDHRDGDGTNNRWGNLRDGTNINSKNKSMLKNNTSGYTGVSWHKQKSKWTGRIKIGDKYKSLGLFESKEEAAKAVATARDLSGYDKRHGVAYSPMRMEQIA